VQVAQIKKSCERLMHEKEMLVQYADALSARLGCFDELEALGAHFHKLSPTASHSELIPLLNRLDECLTYMSSNPQYMDTMSYTLRLRQLQVFLHMQSSKYLL
jgi:conserved oligomeric Golgi complex subunit 3